VSILLLMFRKHQTNYCSSVPRCVVSVIGSAIVAQCYVHCVYIHRTTLNRLIGLWPRFAYNTSKMNQY